MLRALTTLMIFTGSYAVALQPINQQTKQKCHNWARSVVKQRKMEIAKQIEDDHALALRLHAVEQNNERLRIAEVEKNEAIAFIAGTLQGVYPSIQDFDHLLKVADILRKRGWDANSLSSRLQSNPDEMRSLINPILHRVLLDKFLATTTPEPSFNVMQAVQARFSGADRSVLDAATDSLRELGVQNAFDFYTESEKLAASGFFGQDIQRKSKPFTDTMNTHWSRDGIYIGDVNAEKNRVPATDDFIRLVREQLQKDLLGFDDARDIPADFTASLAGATGTCFDVTTKAEELFNEIANGKVQMGYAVAKGRCLVSSVFQLVNGRLAGDPEPIEAHTRRCDEIVKNGIDSRSFTAGDITASNTVALLTIDANNIRYILEKLSSMPNTPVAFHVMRGDPQNFVRHQVVRLNTDKDGEQVNYFIHQGDQHWVPMFSIAELLDHDKAQFEANQARAAELEVAVGQMGAALVEVDDILTSFAKYDTEFIVPYKDYLSDSANSVERDEFVNAGHPRKMQLVKKFVARRFVDQKKIKLRPLLDLSNFDNLLSTPTWVDQFLQAVLQDSYNPGHDSAGDLLKSADIHTPPIISRFGRSSSDSGLRCMPCSLTPHQPHGRPFGVSLANVVSGSKQTKSGLAWWLSLVGL